MQHCGLLLECWFPVYASRQAHARLGPREDCPQYVDDMTNGNPDHLIVR
ncbi:pRL2-8 [Streptomyces sp. 09ZI22]|nr:pRL2-8 [Streptomyces sp. 09ZI22]